jgi:hypothetical protein
MHKDKTPTMGLPQSPQPGSIICLHRVFADSAPVSAERLAAQRPAAEMIAQIVHRWAAEDAATHVAEARR